MKFKTTWLNDVSFVLTGTRVVNAVIGFLRSYRQKFPGGIFGAKTTGRIMYYVTDSVVSCVEMVYASIITDRGAPS